MTDNINVIYRFGLNKCVECRACSESCPSYRNGGIDPQYTIATVLKDSEVKDIWKCLVCHRCAMICPQEINVTGMMLALREIDFKNGNAPEKIKRTYVEFTRYGRLGIPKGRMETVRKELGLDDVTSNPMCVEELEQIMKKAGVRND